MIKEVNLRKSFKLVKKYYTIMQQKKNNGQENLKINLRDHSISTKYYLMEVIN